MKCRGIPLYVARGLEPALTGEEEGAHLSTASVTHAQWPIDTTPRRRRRRGSRKKLLIEWWIVVYIFIYLFINTPSGSFSSVGGYTQVIKLIHSTLRECVQLASSPCSHDQLLAQLKWLNLPVNTHAKFSIFQNSRSTAIYLYKENYQLRKK